MYPKNSASPEPIAIGAVVQISDGVVQTSDVGIRIKPIGVAEADGVGTTSYSTDGIVYYTPTQAETNYTSFILIAKKTGCIPVAITVVTTSSTTPGTVLLAPVTHTSATIPTVTTATSVTTVNGLANNAITDLSINASALNGKGDWNVGKTGYSLTATTGLGNQTANITGNLSGSVGSISGVTFPTNFGATSITAGGIVKADLDTIKTQTVTCIGGVTVPAATLASTTNITAGTLTTVTTATNLTNLPTVPWNAAWDAEVQSEVQDAIEVNHLDHLLAQYYDPDAEPGHVGSLFNGLLEPYSGSAVFKSQTMRNIGTTLFSHSASGHTSALTLGKVINELVDVSAEPTGAPAFNESAIEKLGYIFAALRNNLTVTSSAITFKDDAGTTLWSKALSDDGTTYTEAEGV